jgi:polyisoprenoid-binding protein YceI
MLRSLSALFLGISLVMSAGAEAQMVSKDPAHAPSGFYKLETGHSLVLFSIMHMGLTDYYGRFDKLSGHLNFVATQPEKSSTEITIDTTSIDTPSDQLNNELRGTSVFSTQQFPTATFKSTSIERTGPDSGKMTGDLTIKGVTKPVVLDVTFTGGEQNPLKNSYALGFHASVTVKRSDFGMTSMMWSPFVGDDVNLIIEAMFEQS